MSFNIQITGHEEFDKVSELEAFERDLAEKVEKFASGIPGVRLAFVSGQKIGHREVVRNDPPEPKVEKPGPPPKGAPVKPGPVKP